MAKKAIKPKKELAGNGSAETNNSQLTVGQDDKLEVVKTATLEELESAAEAALTSFRDSLWTFAVAVTAIHDSGLYEYAGEAGGFYRYMEQRWGIKKAQAANYVAWVKHEIKVELVSQNPVLRLEDIKSNQIDSNVTPPPETPRDGGTAKSRESRKSGSPGAGVPSQNGDPEPETADYLESKKKAIAKIRAAQEKTGDKRSTNLWLDDIGMEKILGASKGWLEGYIRGDIDKDGVVREPGVLKKLNETRPTAEFNSEEVALTDSTDEADSAYVILSNSDQTGVHARLEVALPGDDDMKISLLNQAETILKAFSELNQKNGRISSAEEALKAFEEAISNLRDAYENLPDRMQEAAENQQVAAE
jgi:hypothetical protein